MTSIERTAYPRFKRLITARELHLFFSPGRNETVCWCWRTAVDLADRLHDAVRCVSVAMTRRRLVMNPTTESTDRQQRYIHVSST